MKKTFLPQKDLHAIKRLLVTKIALSFLVFFFLLMVTTESAFGIFRVFGPQMTFAPLSIVFAAVAVFVFFTYLKSFLKIKSCSETA